MKNFADTPQLELKSSQKIKNIDNELCKTS